LPNLIYDLKIKGLLSEKENSNDCYDKLYFEKLEKIIDELTDDSEIACKAFDDHGKFSRTINTEHDGYLDLSEFSVKYPNLIFEITYVDNDSLNVGKTIYKDGMLTYYCGNISFDPIKENQEIAI